MILKSLVFASILMSSALSLASQMPTTSSRSNSPSILYLIGLPGWVNGAFEKSMVERGDVELVHEPFRQVEILKAVKALNINDPEVLDPIVKPMGQIAKESNSFQEILNNLDKFQRIKGKPVFINDFVDAVSEGFADRKSYLERSDVRFVFIFKSVNDTVLEYLENYRKTPASVKATLDCKRALDYNRLLMLYQTLQKALPHNPPMLLNADCLFSDPRDAMSAVCSTYGIEYMEKALSWKKGRLDAWHPHKEVIHWQAVAAESESFDPMLNARPNQMKYNDLTEAEKDIFVEITSDNFSAYVKLVNLAGEEMLNFHNQMRHKNARVNVL